MTAHFHPLRVEMIIGFVMCLMAPVVPVEPAGAQAQPALIPKPVQASMGSGQFTITPATKVLYAKGDDRLADAAEYLAGRLSQAFDKKVAAEATGATEPPGGAILMTTAGADAALGDEGYSLTVTAKGVLIRAPKPAGAFYGGITLLQLAPAEAFRAPAMVEGKLGGNPTGKAPRPCDEPNISTAKPVDSLAVPCAKILDKPTFQWRGLLIDPARHFWTIDELKQYVDYLALHKLNTLQIHLTDVQNWCAEVMKHPRLTPEKERNAANPENLARQTYHRLARHYYTQEELKSLVAFARKRFVNIVPEFEMPGHSAALLRAYPECGCTVDSKPVQDNNVCPGKEKTYQVLQEILDEMLEVFPGQYIHIGGDECWGRRGSGCSWPKCADCQKRMQTEGLNLKEPLTQLHGYFVGRMRDYLQNKKGRTLVGWDDILETGAKSGVVGMYWRGTPDQWIKMALKNEQHLVMTPKLHCYFDFRQSPDGQSEPASMTYGGRFVPLAMAYDLKPIPDFVAQTDRKVVLGVQGLLWGELMKSFPHVLYMTYPRACALSEVAWSPAEGRNYADFYTRLPMHLKRLDAAGIKYRTPTDIDKPGALSGIDTATGQRK